MIHQTVNWWKRAKIGNQEYKGNTWKTVRSNSRIGLWRVKKIILLNSVNKYLIYNNYSILYKLFFIILIMNNKNNNWSTKLAQTKNLQLEQKGIPTGQYLKNSQI